MNIVVICRTLNESRNIERFCEGYGFADKILIADGGSSDDTVEKARKYAHVEVRDFEERVERNGIWRNPHGKHINFLITWAKEERATWIIFDDCDCAPNKMFSSVARDTLARVHAENLPLVYAYRMYLFGEDKWFPKLSKPGQSLWAWNQYSINIWAADLPFQHRLLYGSEGLLLSGIKEDVIHRVDFPLALLHKSWPDEAEIQRKLNFYRQLGEQRAAHPLEWAGDPEPLPEWAKD